MVTFLVCLVVVGGAIAAILSVTIGGSGDKPATGRSQRDRRERLRELSMKAAAFLIPTGVPPVDPRAGTVDRPDELVAEEPAEGDDALEPASGSLVDPDPAGAAAPHEAAEGAAGAVGGDPEGTTPQDDDAGPDAAGHVVESPVVVEGETAPSPAPALDVEVVDDGAAATAPSPTPVPDVEVVDDGVLVPTGGHPAPASTNGDAPDIGGPAHPDIGDLPLADPDLVPAPADGDPVPAAVDGEGAVDTSPPAPHDLDDLAGAASSSSRPPSGAQAYGSASSQTVVLTAAGDEQGSSAAAAGATVAREAAPVDRPAQQGTGRGRRARRPTAATPRPSRSRRALRRLRGSVALVVLLLGLGVVLALALVGIAALVALGVRAALGT